MQHELEAFIRNALSEDIGSGDHSSLACIPAEATRRARLLVKEDGVLAGVNLALEVFRIHDTRLKTTLYMADGATIRQGDVAFEVEGPAQSILAVERLVLNIMQRMSGIATTTRRVVDLVEGTGVRILDTRKTTPGLRYLEKMAVRIGGGVNHRFGLYDMIMLKDNHIDYAGGIPQAMVRVRNYMNAHGLRLPVEVEARNMDEVTLILKEEGVTRIMLDNFDPAQLKAAVAFINRQMETEASGGITPETVRAYAETGVDYISMGALTHSVKSLDLSLKAFD
ncbi:MAG: carboxylating nicotinate-nucleotide diphosphorylase [Flavobacteriales bacterium]